MAAERWKRASAVHAILEGASAYVDLGENYPDERSKTAVIGYMTRRLEKLGFKVVPAVLPRLRDKLPRDRILPRRIWTGFKHACAVRATGTVVCWGFAGQGQLGAGPFDGSAVSASPIDVKGLVAARRVSTGGDRSCAVTADNRAYCWGANTLGQLGNGGTTRAYTPTPVSDFP